MTSLLIGDLLLRGASIGVLGLLVVRLLSIRPPRFLGLSFSLFSLSVINYLVVSSPLPLIGQGRVAVFFTYAPVLFPFWLWWAGQALFVDHFRARLWHGLLALAVILPVLFLERFDGAELARTLISYALYGHLIFVAIATSSADLVEDRRRFRIWFILSVVVFAGIVQWFEVSAVGHGLPPTGYPVQPLVTLVLATAFAIWTLRVNTAIWQPETPAKSVSENPKANTHLMDRLKVEMDSGIWRQEGLSISQLAERMNIPAHQLRVVINGTLGYRNFSAFVNERRIAAACAILEDPAQFGLPILSVAFDVGFASIGPFNRAFREATGQSPSAYRAGQAKAG